MAQSMSTQVSTPMNNSIVIASLATSSVKRMPLAISSCVLRRLQPCPSGAWQNYPYRRWHGIIGAKKSPVLPKGVSYAHCHYANPHGLPQGAADSTTTGLLGANCAPADESPAAGPARQDSFSAGDGSQPGPRDAPDAPQSRDGTHMAPAMACSGPQAGADC